MPYREAEDALRATRTMLERASAEADEELAMLRDSRALMRTVADRIAGGARRLERSVELSGCGDVEALLAAVRSAYRVEGLALPERDGALWTGRPEVLTQHQVQVRIDLSARPGRAALVAVGGAPWHLFVLSPLLLAVGASVLDGSHPIAALVCTLATLGLFARARARYLRLTRRRALGLHRCAHAMQRCGATVSEPATRSNPVCA